MRVLLTRIVEDIPKSAVSRLSSHSGSEGMSPGPPFHLPTGDFQYFDWSNVYLNLSFFAGWRVFSSQSSISLTCPTLTCLPQRFWVMPVPGLVFPSFS